MYKVFCATIVVLIFTSCNSSTRYSGYPKIEGISDSMLVSQSSVGVEEIKVTTIDAAINGSQIIEEFKYLPLETTQESLIAYYRKIVVYQDLIYILDDITAEAVFIYNMDGKFIKKVGYKGGGPAEFSSVRGMCIDKENNYLVVYDQYKSMLKYFTLMGEFVKNIHLPFASSGQFEVLAPNKIAFVTSKNDHNYHLEKYDSNRIVFIDTLGNITNFGLDYDDNANLHIAWSEIIKNDDNILFYPQFTNSIYSISDTLIREKYKINCDAFSPFDLEKLMTFKGNEEFDEYRKTKTLLDPPMSENDTHFFFCIANNGYRSFQFYDKRSKKLVGFNELISDNNFVLYFPNIYSYGDWFVGRVTVESLELLMKGSVAKPEELKRMINNLEEDDNSPLVFFKIKEL